MSTDPGTGERPHEATPGNGTTPPQVRELVLAALEETNALRPEGGQVELRDDAPIASPEGPLDSLGIVNLVASLEGRVQERWGASAGLMEALALPLETSPFRTVATLLEHVDRARPGGGGA